MLVIKADNSFLARLCDKPPQPVNLQQLRCSKPIRGAMMCGQHCRRIMMLDTDILICEHLSLLLSAYICDKDFVLSF